MPEGDTIFRSARTLHRALAGRTITRFETGLAPLAALDRATPIAGRTVLTSEARGKHLLLTLSGDLVLRTHMRMHGSWHLYRPDERWRAPRRDARIVIATTVWMAIAFNVNDAEFVTADALVHHARLSALGPDLLAPEFDAVLARERLREVPARHIAEALLRQQAMAGLGNVFKSEVLFICRVHPFLPVQALPDATLDDLIERSKSLIRLNVREGSTTPATVGRVTTGRMNPKEALWVYGRAGLPCRRCGASIRSESETDGRRTYWCPACQPAPAVVTPTG